jgi:hypothetical protein
MFLSLLDLKPILKDYFDCIQRFLIPYSTAAPVTNLVSARVKEERHHGKLYETVLQPERGKSLLTRVKLTLTHLLSL